VRAQVVRESHVIHYQSSLGTLRLQLECEQRVLSFRPISNAPCLDDTLIGHELYVPAGDHTTKARKCATRLTIDLGWCTTGERAELF
jgi:hypothetical protein